MLTKPDCMSILIKLEDQGINVDSYIKQLITSKEVPIEVLKFIAKNRGIELCNFYEMLRKSHNQKKSPLYTNILKEVSSPEEVVLTLSSLLQQIILYNRKLVNNTTFLKEARAEEITRVLNEYFKEEKLDDCLSLLKLVKTDLLVLEYLTERREAIN